MDPTAFTGDRAWTRLPTSQAGSGERLATLNLLDLCWPGGKEEAESERNLGSFGVQK